MNRKFPGRDLNPLDKQLLLRTDAHALLPLYIYAIKINGNNDINILIVRDKNFKSTKDP